MWKRTAVFILGISTTLSQILALLTSIVYVSRYASEDLEDSAKTVFQIAAYTNSSYLMCVSFLKRNQILHIVNEFQRIYDTSMVIFATNYRNIISHFQFSLFDTHTHTYCGRTSAKFLRNARELNEKIVIFFLRTFVIFFFCTLILGIAMIAYCYVVYGRFDANKLFLLYNYA